MAADVRDHEASSNGVGNDAARVRTLTSTDDDPGTTIKLSAPTHQLLRQLRTRLRRQNDAVIRKALRMLAASETGQVQTDDEWADS